MSQCKSCGADIEWIEYAGKRHPLDVRKRQGFYKLVDTWTLGTFRESHFATCPDADKHRKAKNVN